MFNAVRDGDIEPEIEDSVTGAWVKGIDAQTEWLRVRETFKPNQVAVWIDDTVLNLAKKWLDEHNGIVWCEHVAFGKRLSELSGRPYYGQGGMCGDKPIEDERGPCIASIAANSEGRNLQHYSEGLIVSVSPDAAGMEQMLGRMHRDGQLADEVTFEILLPCKEAFACWSKLLQRARYIEESTAQSQKVLFADLGVMSAEDAALKGGPLWG